MLRAIAPDTLQQTTPTKSQTIGENTSHGLIALWSDVFEHSHGDHGIELSENIAIVIFDEFNLLAKTQLLATLPRPLDLLTGDAEPSNADAVIFRHVQGKCAPAATDIQNTFSAFQVQLATDVVHFCNLSGIEIHRRRSEISARIDHLVIEPQMEKLVAEIVVPMNILTRAM